MPILAKITLLILAICFLISLGRQTLWGPFDIGMVLLACWVIVAIWREIVGKERPSQNPMFMDKTGLYEIMPNGQTRKISEDVRKERQ